MVLWKFLAEHAKKDLRVVFSGEFNEDEYLFVAYDELKAAEYLRGWPPR